MRKFMKRAGVAVAALMVGALAMGGVAYAFPTFFFGTVANAQLDVTETNPFFVPAGAPWHDVPSTTLGAINVPAGATRVVESTFGAETTCLNAAWCSVRVVYVDAAGVETEFSPVVGLDFMFDSPAGGAREQHSMHRVARLAPGNYTFKVQAQAVGAAAGYQFTLDDYTHFIDVIL